MLLRDSLTRSTGAGCNDLGKLFRYYSIFQRKSLEKYGKSEKIPAAYAVGMKHNVMLSND